MADKKIPSNWWKLLEAVEHTWKETTTIHWGKEKKVKLCTTCGSEDYGYGPQFHSCQITTDWPGDDSPCMCTRRRYLEAHHLIN